MQLQSAHDRLVESQAQVSNLRKDLDASQETAVTDPLTGVGNRRLFDVMMDRAVQRANEDSGNHFLYLIDLDKFKDINDTFGHSVGDEVLKFVAGEIQQIRSDLSIARYGGDEFAVFLKNVDVDQASSVADQVRRVCSTKKLTLTQSGEQLGRVGLSVGVACLRAEDDAQSWFQRADKLLYRAKESGRNCVMVERSRDH